MKPCRFERSSDIFIQKFLRLIFQLELEPEGSVRDRINLAEKKGMIKSAEVLAEIRILRNSISHEYTSEALKEIFKNVMKYTPILLNDIESTNKYCRERFLIK